MDQLGDTLRWASLLHYLPAGSRCQRGGYRPNPSRPDKSFRVAPIAVYPHAASSGSISRSIARSNATRGKAMPRAAIRRMTSENYQPVPRADQSRVSLMLAARINFPHFSVSSAMSLPKSAGEPESTLPPRSASFILSLASARPALISILSLSTISMGVWLGKPMPNQELTS